MLELLRALAQSEASTMEQAGGSIAIDLGPSLSLDSNGFEPPPRSEPAGSSLPGHSEGTELSGLNLLRSKLFDSEPEETELRCHYCSRVFKLRDGGASFEGNAACWRCEQHLNREFVLPAVSKHRPHLYQACEVAEGPDQPGPVPWTNQHPSASPAEDETAEAQDRPAEALPEAAEEEYQGA